MLKKILSVYKKDGIKTLLVSLKNRYSTSKLIILENCQALIKNKSGLEIGGPSAIFSEKGMLPLYPIVKELDNCNFSSNTIWEGNLKAGRTFEYDKNHSMGLQFILDTTNLDQIETNYYDFILSSHVIEHLANPIKALSEWIRVLKNDGILLIIIPHKDGTFDHKRNVTALRHIVEDYEKNSSEDDLTHLEEILNSHDLKKDIAAGTFEDFKARSINNFSNRCLHHHVFDTYSAISLINYLKLKILFVESFLPFHILIVAKKSAYHDNEGIVGMFTNNKINTPFMTDKLLIKEMQNNN